MFKITTSLAKAHFDPTEIYWISRAMSGIVQLICPIAKNDAGDEFYIMVEFASYNQINHGGPSYHRTEIKVHIVFPGTSGIKVVIFYYDPMNPGDGQPFICQNHDGKAENIGEIWAQLRKTHSSPRTFV